VPLVPDSLVNIAPERREHLIDELQGVTFQILAEPRFAAHYTPATKTITLSFRAVEILWCVAYAHVVLFDLYAARRSDDRTQVDLTATPVVKEAMELLRWALQDWIDKAGTPVPALPQRAPRDLGSAAAVADELCLCAVAFILHHELAHHRLNHTVIPPRTKDAELLRLSIAQERDADAEAADWILTLASKGTRFFTKRAAGIVVALMAMVAKGVHTREHDGHDHPRHFDRLFNTIDRYSLGPNDPPWVFATVALKLHIDHSGYKAPAVEYESFRDCISAYIDVIAEAERVAEEDAKRNG
jgi:hypothetical protein